MIYHKNSYKSLIPGLIAMDIFSVNNQTLLWNIINRNAKINILPSSQKPIWFKDNMNLLYHSPAFPKVAKSNEELTQINKHLLSHLLDDLSRLSLAESALDPSNLVPPGYQHSSALSSSLPPAPPIVQPYTSETSQAFNRLELGQVTRTHITNNPNNISADFERIKKEYEDSYNPKPPEKIDFSVANADEPIQNISSLIEKHLKEREEDVLKYGTGGTTTVPSTTLPPTSPSAFHSPPWESFEKRIQSLETKMDELIKLIVEKVEGSKT